MRQEVMSGWPAALCSQMLPPWQTPQAFSMQSLTLLLPGEPSFAVDSAYNKASCLSKQLQQRLAPVLYLH